MINSASCNALRNILFFFGSVFLTVTATAGQAVEKKPNWRSGVIVAYNYSSAIKTLTVNDIDLSVEVTDPLRKQHREILLRDDHLSMQVRTEDGLFYVSQDLKYIWQKKLDLKEGDTVKVLAKNGRIAIKTDKGKKAKYRYILFVPTEFISDS